MGKRKGKKYIDIDWPSDEARTEISPRIEAAAMKLQYRIYLNAKLGREPTPAELTDAIAADLWHEHKNAAEERDRNIKTGYERGAPVLEAAQKEADKLWADNPGKSKRNVAEILVKRGIGSLDYLRVNLKKPK